MLSLLAYPLSQVLLLGLLGLLLMLLGRLRGAFASVTLALAWLYLSSTGFFANFLMGALEQGYPPRAMSAIETVDAIVLLGGAMRGDAHMGTLPDLNQQADRLVLATALYKAGKAPLILATGGAARGDRPEAEQMRDILAVMGVPRGHILLERQSRNTHDNAVYSALILQAKNMQRILLVTSSWHMRRAQAVFEAQGLEVIPAPTDYQRLVSTAAVPGWLPQARHLARTTYALHELLGYQVYRRRGWI